MKAIVQSEYGSADVLEFKEITAPVAGENEVLVRVQAAGCGPDEEIVILPRGTVLAAKRDIASLA